MSTSKFLRTIKLYRKLSSATIYLLVLVALSGCEQGWGSNLALGILGNTPRTVAQLQTSDRLPRQVKITGTVMDLAPMLDRGAYRIQDDTGSIWVFSSQSLPRLGETLEVKGELDFQSIPIETVEAGQHFLIESERNAVTEQD